LPGTSPTGLAPSPRTRAADRTTPWRTPRSGPTSGFSVQLFGGADRLACGVLSSSRLVVRPVAERVEAGRRRRHVNVHILDVNLKRPPATVLAPRWQTGLLRSAASRGAGIGPRSHRRWSATSGARRRRAGDADATPRVARPPPMR
jgi:hypothetical protein